MASKTFTPKSETRKKEKLKVTFNLYLEERRQRDLTCDASQFAVVVVLTESVFYDHFAEKRKEDVPSRFCFYATSVRHPDNAWQHCGLIL